MLSAACEHRKHFWLLRAGGYGCNQLLEPLHRRLQSVPPHGIVAQSLLLRSREAPLDVRDECRSARVEGRLATKSCDDTKEISSSLTHAQFLMLACHEHYA